MAHYILNVPHQYNHNGETQTRYTRVGVLFENHNRNTGEIYFTLKLNFPVGATELLAFQPRAKDDDEDPGA